MTFIERESYAHKLSKILLTEWFREGHIINILDLEVARDEPLVAISEYPIVVTKGYNSLKNCWGNICNWLGKEELLCETYVPSFEDCIEHLCYPIAVIDLVIIYKGIPSIFIEVCHKSPTTEEKIEKLKNEGINNFYEVDAFWLLSQIEPPTSIRAKDLMLQN